MLGAAAQGGAGSAPASSGTSQGGHSPSGPGQGAPEGGGAGGFDSSAALAEIRKARQGMQKLSSEFDNYKKDAESDRATLKRMRDAMNPEQGQGQEADPHAEAIGGLEQQLDYYLEQAMLAREAGKNMPLTTNLAIQFFQSQIQNLKTQQQMQALINELKSGVQHAADPATPVNSMAYAQMETYLQQSLDQLYGGAQENARARQHVYQAVTSQLAQDLKALQKAAPQKWDMLRRNPGQMQKVVAQALRSIVPPKAMQLIEQDQLQNTPMSEGELWAAWREAKEKRGAAKDPASAKHFTDIMTKIRQDILKVTQAPRKRAAR